MLIFQEIENAENFSSVLGLDKDTFFKFFLLTFMHYCPNKETGKWKQFSDTSETDLEQVKQITAHNGWTVQCWL